MRDQKRKKWLIETIAKNMMKEYDIDDYCYCLTQSEILIDEVINDSNENGIKFLNNCTSGQLTNDLL